MSGMSNSLRQRLGAGPEPRLHPDSDLLTAYIERSLAPAEQADMVRHLAACSYCREVVALSLPEVQVLPAVVPVRRPSFWFPMLRWSAVAATLLIGATLLIEKPWKSRLEPAVVTDTAAQKTMAQNAAAPPPPPVAAGAPSVEKDRDATAGHAGVVTAPSQTAGLQASEVRPSSVAIGGLAKKSAVASLRQDVASGSGGAPASAFVADARNSKQLDAVSVTNGFSANGLPSPVVAAETGALVSAPAPKPEVTSQNTRFLARTIPITPESIRNSALAVTFGDEKAKADASTTAGSPGAQGGSRVFTFPRKIITASKDKLAGAVPSRTAGMAMMEKEAMPRAEAAPPAERLHWSISPDGKLIKSADLNVWHEVYPQKDDLLFRVVVAEGHDVWAGGSHLTLIHSWNGGVDWKKMKLGETATGDITDIVIGNGDVQVKTSNDQTWVSQDGGVTWVPLKQPALPQPK